MKRRARASTAPVERLKSTDARDWVGDDERAVIAQMVADARAAWRFDPAAKVELDRLAPAARWRAIGGTLAGAIHGVENLVVQHRRRLAGREYAIAARMPFQDVARMMHLGWLTSDGHGRWLASTTLSGGER